METSTTTITQWVGIDVAKATLDVMILPAQTRFQVPNTESGWTRLQAQLGQRTRTTRIVLEPTGSYHLGLVIALDAAGWQPVVVNPRWVRDFAGSTGQTAKTDTLDALVLARYAQVIEPVSRGLPAANVRQVQALIARRADVVKMRTMEKNRLPVTATELQDSVTTVLAALTAEIASLDARIAATVAADPDLRARVQLLQTAPGIGPLIGPLLAARLPELEALTRREAAALAGVAPYARDSGTMRGKRFVRGGRADVTQALYQAMTTACSRNPVLQARYRHLRDDLGKPHKVALIACGRWLLGVLIAMIREDITWQETRAANPPQFSVSEKTD